jgi:hypothetical protein
MAATRGLTPANRHACGVLAEVERLTTELEVLLPKLRGERHGSRAAERAASATTAPGSACSRTRPTPRAARPDQ